MNFSSASTSTVSNHRTPSSHHEFFAKLYGSFDDKNVVKNVDGNDKTSHEKENVENNNDDDNICVDDDVDSDSDDTSYDDRTLSLERQNDVSTRHDLSPPSPTLQHPTPGNFLINFSRAFLSLVLLLSYVYNFPHNCPYFIPCIQYNPQVHF